MPTPKIWLVCLGVLCLSSMFLQGCPTTSSECPTGAYLGEEGVSTFNLSTTDGIVSGDIPDPGDCLTDFTISGTSDGSQVTFTIEAQDMTTECCNIVEFSLTATPDCKELEGTISYPPDSNCSDLPDEPYVLNLI